jgi:iron-sulfur cluster repair protein YtfE (RIC family)
MWFTRGFSLTNFVIGTSALSFQVFVLYPWHEQLDEEFKELRKEHARLLDETHRQHRQELRTIREQLEALNQTKGRGWFR